METFDSAPGFCPVCGTILPPLKQAGNVRCYNCHKEFDPDVFGEEQIEYIITFNTYNPRKVKQEAARKLAETEIIDGPVIERKCPKCSYDKMTYATLQLRSADEGQTVFFTCIKCKFKESENS